MSLEFLEGRRLSVMWVLYYFCSGIWWEPIKVMQLCLKQLAWISVWFCLVRSTFLMGRTWSLCIISQAHRWALQKCLLDIVMCGKWQDKSIYEQSCLWAACRSHDMPVLVVTAQLCSTFVYERQVHVLNSLAHLEAIDSSVANTREQEGKRGVFGWLWLLQW